MTRNPDPPHRPAPLPDRWSDLRDALDAHYRIDAYPYAADRILNDARHRRLRGAPRRSQAAIGGSTDADYAAAIALCERHRRRRPDALPEPPPRIRRHYVRRIDDPTTVALHDRADALDLAPEHVVAVAVHELLARETADHGAVLDMLFHLLWEIECHGNVPDPARVSDHDPDDILQIPDFIVPWHYVPGRPATRRRDRWHALCDRLAVHYRWYGYPTAETRILLAAEGPAADALPDDPWDHGSWSARDAAVVRACCERYLRTDPDRLPPLPQRGLRYYDSLATPSTIAAFATACEELRLNPEDAIVLALHSLCVTDAPGTPEAMETLVMIIQDIQFRGNVLAPDIVPDSLEQVM